MRSLPFPSVLKCSSSNRAGPPREPSPRQSNVFSGGGHVLGGEDVESRYVPDPTARKSFSRLVYGCTILCRVHLLEYCALISARLCRSLRSNRGRLHTVHICAYGSSRRYCSVELVSCSRNRPPHAHESGRCTLNRLFFTASEDPEDIPTAIRRITFWREGFSVDQDDVVGELRRYDDPENAQYLREINEGYASSSHSLPCTR